MALAYLLKNIDSQSLGFSLSPTALIVDHSMRNGSDLEARKVMDWCQKLGSFNLLMVAYLADYF